jgi:malic enzyme
MEKQGNLSPQAAASNFWVLDKDGLITQARPNQLDYVSRFARPEGETVREGAGLLEVVKTVKPTVLLGLAGEGWGIAVLGLMSAGVVQEAECLLLILPGPEVLSPLCGSQFDAVQDKAHKD